MKQTRSFTLLIAGGGTGGHLFPGIAVAQEIKRRDPAANILFVGTERGIEVRAVPRAGFELTLLKVAALRGKGVLGAIKSALQLPLALIQACRLVRQLRPHIAVSVGGYAAGPAVLASRLLGVPCIVMEQNAVPGVTNRVLGKLATRIVAGLPTFAFPAHKMVTLGNPVRADLLPVRAQTYAPGARKCLLVVGGSQGARALNEAMMAAASQLKTLPLSIVHQTGKSDCERVLAAYAAADLHDVKVLPFIDDMAAAYGQADVVLCRSGAMTLAELTVCGRPAILVPFPQAADDHQTANARILADVGAAVLLPQSQLDAASLLAVVQELINDTPRLVRMAEAARNLGQPSAASDTADLIMKESHYVS